MPRSVQGVLCLSLVAALAAPGCGPHFGRVDPREGDLPPDLTLPTAPALVAGFAPVKVRVHPLSRFEGSGETRRAVVDVEILDAFGHDVKWPGLLKVEAATSESFQGASSRWMDLTDPDANARAFDGISRCYPVRIPAAGTGALWVRVKWLQATAEGGTAALEASGQLQPGK